MKWPENSKHLNSKMYHLDDKLYITVCFSVWYSIWLIGFINSRCPSSGLKQFAGSITCSCWPWWAETKPRRCSRGWTTRAQVSTTPLNPSFRVNIQLIASQFHPLSEYANLAFWTGGWRDKNSSTWLWQPWGAQVAEAFWLPGEPRGDPRQESRIHFRAADKGWHDDQTRAAASVLCEITSWKSTFCSLICLGGIWVTSDDMRTGAWAQSNFGRVCMCARAFYLGP